MTNFDYFDETLFDMAHKIARFGYTTMSVNAGECSVPSCECFSSPGPTWTYSIGLLEHKHPEIVIVGAPPDRAYELIDLAYDGIRSAVRCRLVETIARLPQTRPSLLWLSPIAVGWSPISWRSGTTTTALATGRHWMASTFRWCNSSLLTTWDAFHGMARTTRLAVANRSSRTTIRRGRDGIAKPAAPVNASVDAEGTDDPCYVGRAVGDAPHHREPPMSLSAFEIRAGLDHPVVDSDAHWLEAVPVFLDYFRDQRGPDAAAIFAQLTGHFYDRWHNASQDERRVQRLPRAPWWAEPAATLDRATATLPGLLYERLFLSMTLLAIPPIFTNVYTGIAGVDDAYRDAARGLGMTTRQQLLRTEIPIAAPLLVTGLRIAVVQVIATATIGAYAGTGGLGRFIIDGFALQDYPQVFGGALLVAALAIIGDRALMTVERHVSHNSPHS